MSPARSNGDHGGRSLAGGTTTVFTYSPPTVTSLSVTSGPAAGGTKVKIIGTGLKGATPVRFGSVAATAVAMNCQGDPGDGHARRPGWRAR